MGISKLALCRNYGLERRHRLAGRDGSEQGHMGRCISRQLNVLCCSRPSIQCSDCQVKVQGSREMLRRGGFFILRLSLHFETIFKCHFHPVWQMITLKKVFSKRNDHVKSLNYYEGDNCKCMSHWFAKCFWIKTAQTKLKKVTLCIVSEPKGTFVCQRAEGARERNYLET